MPSPNLNEHIAAKMTDVTYSRFLSFRPPESVERAIPRQRGASVQAELRAASPFSGASVRQEGSVSGLQDGDAVGGKFG